jgi:hypothetical protein
MKMLLCQSSHFLLTDCSPGLTLIIFDMLRTEDIKYLDEARLALAH